MVNFPGRMKQVRGTLLFIADKEKRKLPPGETVKVSRGSAEGRKAPPARSAKPAKNGLPLFGGSAFLIGLPVKSAFALLLEKVTKEGLHAGTSRTMNVQGGTMFLRCTWR